jgi:hypothetical protein
MFNSSFAEMNNTICIKEDAQFHSKNNKIILSTQSDNLWLATSNQKESLPRGCYSLKKTHTSVKIDNISNELIVSDFYKISNEANSATFTIENRKS